MGAIYTEAQARAMANYEAKTFKRVLFKLRLDEDADIIASYDEAKEHGIKKNEWLREMFDGKGVPVKKVEKVLEKYEIDSRIIAKIINELER